MCYFCVERRCRRQWRHRALVRGQPNVPRTAGDGGQRRVCGCIAAPREPKGRGGCGPRHTGASMRLLDDKPTLLANRNRTVRPWPRTQPGYVPAPLCPCHGPMSWQGLPWRARWYHWGSTATARRHLLERGKIECMRSCVASVAGCSARLQENASGLNPPPIHARGGSLAAVGLQHLPGATAHSRMQHVTHRHTVAGCCRRFCAPDVRAVLRAGHERS